MPCEKLHTRKRRILRAELDVEGSTDSKSRPEAGASDSRPLRHQPKAIVLRGVVSVLFCAAGVCHFVWPKAYMSIMPPFIPWPRMMVLLSGVFEIAGGIGILLPRFRKAAGIGLVALLIAVFPANVQMLSQEWIRSNSQVSNYSILLLLRLPLQTVLMLAVWKAAFPGRRPC